MADKQKNYLSVGRVNQKLRTRDALVGIAANFVRAGKPVSVAEIADAAHVSRTTAYRYFPTPEMLEAQASLLAAGSIETDHLDELVQGPGTPEDKVDGAIVASDAMTRGHEAAFRAVLRLSLEPRSDAAPELPRRPSFRPGWFNHALADLREPLGEQRFNDLVAALCHFCGVESMVVLQDVCRLNPTEAKRVKRWAAQLLLRGALLEAEKTAAKPKRHGKA